MFSIIVAVLFVIISALYYLLLNKCIVLSSQRLAQNAFGSEISSALCSDIEYVK